MNWGPTSRGQHLGTRVSALLDGQLSAADTDAAWSHVAGCAECRDSVQREAWIKQRMAGLSALTTAPPSLKGDLMRPEHCSQRREHRRAISLAAVGGGAVGAAMMGFIALSPAPAAAPTPGGVATTPSSTVLTPVSMMYVRR